MAASLPVFASGAAPAWTLIMATLSAAAYATAMIAMKYWPGGAGVGLALIIALFVFVGVVTEIAALRGERLGMIYVAILAVEVVIIGLAAKFTFGETYSLRELAGCFLVVTGALVAWA